MAVFYCKSGAGAAEFAQSTAYVSGDKIVPKYTDTGSNYLVARKWVWECTTGGTSAGAEPTWPASVTQDVTTVTSNTAVFTARKPGFSSGTTADWSFATIYFEYASGCPTASYDVVYISNNHAENHGNAVANVNTQNYLSFLCVDDSVATPTTLATTASVTTSAVITLTGSTHNYDFYGITFTSGSGSGGNVDLNVTGAVFRNCTFVLAAAGTASKIYSSAGSCLRLYDCWVKFNAAAQFISIANAYLHWTGGGLASGGTSPTNFVTVASGLVENVDLSNASSTINLGGTSQNNYLTFRNIKLPSGWSGILNIPNVGGAPQFHQLMNGASTGTNYALFKQMHAGNVVHETTIVRTGGATDGTTRISWKMVSNTNSTLYPINVVITPEIVVWNNTTGSAVTATIEIVSSASVNNDEVWLEVQYLSAAGAPLGATQSSGKVMLAAAAAVPTSTATWASSPATPVYQKLSVTFTPQMKGFIHAVVKLCKNTKTIYVDPKITLS